MKMRIIICIFLSLFFFSCRESEVENSVKIDVPVVDSIAVVEPKVEKIVGPKEYLFLDYFSNIDQTEFDSITAKLIKEQKLRKRKNGSEYELHYLFPSCLIPANEQQLDDYTAYKFVPDFEDGLLRSLRLERIGAASFKQIIANRVSCLYKTIMDKYQIDYIYEGSNHIQFREYTMNNKQFDPVDRIRLNPESEDLYATPKYIDLPNYLKDKSKFLLPGETNIIFEKLDDIPDAIEPIIIEDGNRVLIISFNRRFDSTTSYSLWETDAYANLKNNIKFKYINTFVANSKLVHIKDHFELTVSLDYISKQDFQDRLDEQRKADEILKDSVPNRPKRSGFDEL
jgi:hypothetical protein